MDDRIDSWIFWILMAALVAAGVWGLTTLPRGWP
jgi:hypothetical protein